MKENIKFTTSDVKNPVKAYKKDLSLWLNQVAELESVKIKKLTYIFCSDEYLLDINKTYLNHDYYTDIITFPYRQGDLVESDIFISIDRVKENASKLNITFQNELLRVMVHGLLHLVGFDDHSEKDIKIMRIKENKYIDLCLNN